MSEFNIDISKLPEDVRDKLAELDLELSEGKFSFHKKIIENSSKCFLENVLILLSEACDSMKGLLIQP